MSVVTLRRVRSFYLAYPGGSTIPIDAEGLEIRSIGLTELARAGQGVFPPVPSCSHYLILLRIRDDRARAFYELEAAR